MPASLIVIDPGGNQSRVEIESIPFHIGRQPDNQLVIRDSRASRIHARIVREDGDYILEDQKSRHGVLVNGTKVERHRLQPSDRIEFGFPDSYQLVFTLDTAAIHRLVEQFPTPDRLSGTLGSI